MEGTVFDTTLVPSNGVAHPDKQAHNLCQNLNLTGAWTSPVYKAMRTRDGSAEYLATTPEDQSRGTIAAYLDDNGALHWHYAGLTTDSMEGTVFDTTLVASNGVAHPDKQAHNMCQDLTLIGAWTS